MRRQWWDHDAGHDRVERQARLVLPIGGVSAASRGVEQLASYLVRNTDWPVTRRSYPYRLRVGDSRDTTGGRLIGDHIGNDY